MRQFLFSSRGEWIAYRAGKFIYNSNMQLIGWIPFNNGVVVKMNSRYLGTIYDDDRLFKQIQTPYIPYTGYPGFAGFIGYAGFPNYKNSCLLPLGTIDLNYNDLQP